METFTFKIDFETHIGDIVISHDPEVPLSMEEFTLTVLSKLKFGETARVHKIYSEFNFYRKGIHKKEGKYTSFRAVVSKMKVDGYIKSTAEVSEDLFRPSAYIITDMGKRRLSLLQNSRV